MVGRWYRCDHPRGADVISAINAKITEWDATATVQVAEAQDIALLLFDDYLLAFEALGVLLLAAVIGGLYLAKRDDDMPETNNPAGSSRDEEEGI